MTTPRYFPEPIGLIGTSTASSLDLSPLTALIPKLSSDPLLLGRRIRDAISELSEQTMMITFHLPLEHLKVAPDAILLKHGNFIYGSLRWRGDWPLVAVTHVARTCCNAITTVERHLISTFQMHHPDLLSPPVTSRERTVLTLWRAGRSREMIATDLVISPNTVKTHLQRLHRKLGGEEFWQLIVQAENVGFFHYLEC